MSKKDLKLTTLTPLHIGSGKELMANFEYLYFRNQGEVALVDEKKVLGIIGHDNIDQWVGIIERQDDLLDYLEKRKTDLKPSDVAHRVMNVRDKGIAGKNIKEYWHNGQNKPTIPGSSLKGAVRTALFSHLAKNDKQWVESEISENFYRHYTRKKRFRDKAFQQKFFQGDKPQQDFFRLIKIGDAHGQQSAVNQVRTMNIFGSMDNPKWDFKNQIDQWAEVIPENIAAETTITLDQQLLGYKKGRQQFPKLPNLPELDELMGIINESTLSDLKQEKSFMAGRLEADQTNIDYTKYLRHLDALIEDCQRISDSGSTDSAIMRMGFGSGWLSITGDWLEPTLNEDLFGPIYDSLRHERYEGMPFPKTRKVTGSQQPLGFVKLQITS
jgi:CRISPR type III-A-associated RAMP protein Csm5